MSLRTFLRTYREEIDRRIREAGTPVVSQGVALRRGGTESIRAMWIRHHPDLYHWARSLGVKL